MAVEGLSGPEGAVRTDGVGRIFDPPCFCLVPAYATGGSGGGKDKDGAAPGS